MDGSWFWVLKLPNLVWCEVMGFYVVCCCVVWFDVVWCGVMWCGPLIPWPLGIDICQSGSWPDEREDQTGQWAVVTGQWWLGRTAATSQSVSQSVRLPRAEQSYGETSGENWWDPLVSAPPSPPHQHLQTDVRGEVGAYLGQTELWLLWGSISHLSAVRIHPTQGNELLQEKQTYRETSGITNNIRLLRSSVRSGAKSVHLCLLPCNNTECRATDPPCWEVPQHQALHLLLPSTQP